MYLTLSGCLLIFALAMVLLGEWLWGIYVGVVAALTTVSAFKIGRLSETNMERADVSEP
jgi:fluoride ion exporter CrcB/FEX